MEVTTVQGIWDTYLESLCSKDMSRMSARYADGAVLRIVEVGKGAEGVTSAAGVSQITQTLQSFVGTRLTNITTFRVQMEDVNDVVIPGMVQVFASWECPSSGLTNVTETLLVDAASLKIITHNLVLS
eukprot:Rhum_TRINITY_DN6230_c0_g1::Rhum_TRINITY_DN6230_c0_g1_i1::g.19470::m.19470